MFTNSMCASRGLLAFTMNYLIVFLVMWLGSPKPAEVCWRAKNAIRAPRTECSVSPLTWAASKVDGLPPC